MGSVEMKRGKSSARTKAFMAFGVASLLVVSLMLSACGSSKSGEKTASASNEGSAKASSSTGSSESSSEGGGAAEAPSGEVKMAAALNGPKNDESFNQSSYEGMQAALKEFPNLKLTSVLENEADEQQTTDALNTLGPLNNLVLAVSSSFSPTLEAVAPEFPESTFIQVAGAPTTYLKNVTSFDNDWGALGYIVGILAGHLTKTGVIGHVGGEPVPADKQGEAGFEAGAKSVNPKVKILDTITGSYNNVSEAKAATAAMIDEGADVIYPELDSGTAGAYQAGKESGKDPAMFKLTIPKCEAYPNIVGTAIVHNNVAAEKLIKAYMHKTLKPGAILLALQEPEIQRVELCPKYKANKEIAQLTKTAVEEVNDGKRKIPAAALNPAPSYPYAEGFAEMEEKGMSK